MSTEFKTKIKRSLFDCYPRSLHLHPNFIHFENKNLIRKINTVFKFNTIKEFRYGIHWYRYRFVFGREYQIFIRNHDNKVIKINFSTYFGRKKKVYNEHYSNIIDSLWNLYFKPQVNEYLEEFESGESFNIGEVNINPEGIIIRVSKLIKLEKQLILWENARIQDYYNYFSIYSAEDPREIHRGYLYKEDWNTSVLHSVIKTILSNKKQQIEHVV